MRIDIVVRKNNMSADEDTELRDLVAQTLESNGVLGKIRVSLCINKLYLLNAIFLSSFYVKILLQSFVIYPESCLLELE